MGCMGSLLGVDMVGRLMRWDRQLVTRANRVCLAHRPGGQGGACDTVSYRHRNFIGRGRGTISVRRRPGARCAWIGMGPLHIVPVIRGAEGAVASYCYHYGRYKHWPAASSTQGTGTTVTHAEGGANHGGHCMRAQTAPPECTFGKRLDVLCIGWRLGVVVCCSDTG